MKLQVWTLTICFLLLAPLSIKADHAQSAPQMPDGVASQMDKLFAKWDKPDSPGCAVGVVRDGKVVFARGYGLADIEHQIPISTKTVFNLHSLSKSFVAMSVVMLVKQGKLSFDDDVRKYIPELPDYGKPITIRHLLQHTSGLPDVENLIQNVGWRDDERITQEQLLELIVHQKALNCPPGEAFSYTNSVMVLLPLVIKRVTGKTMREFMQENIFTPLGMKNSQYRDEPRTIIQNRANGYHEDKDRGYVQSRSASNAVFTTVEDLARWDQNFYTGAVSGKEVFDWMQTPTKLPSGELTGHGMGLYLIDYRGQHAIYHGGDGGDGHTMFAQFPALRFSVIVLSNASNASAMNLAIGVMNIFLQKEFEEAERRQSSGGGGNTQAASSPHASVPIPISQLEQYAGTYFSTDGSPMVRRFVVKEGVLKWLRDNGKQTHLIALGAGRFQVEGDTTIYDFRSPKANAPMQLKRVIEGNRTRTFEKVKETPTTVSATTYAGRYYSDELDAYVDFIARDGKLFYRWPRQAELDALEPIFTDGFRDESNCFFHFTRDAKGQITGLSFHQDRIWHLRYVRAH